MSAPEASRHRIQLRRRIFEIERLGSVPQVIWRLIEALGDDRINTAELVRIIENDPALVAKVLSLANSAYYGLPHKVATIDRAVIIIGFQELQVLALGVGLADIFDPSQFPAGLDGEMLWLHCLAVSWTAGRLAELAGYPSPREVMVAGLLHDLGKMVLAIHVWDEYRRVYELVDQGMPYFEAEEHTELKHTEVGYWLAVNWGLPNIHTSVIRDHHLPRETDTYFASTCLVTLADLLVKKAGLGLAHESAPLDLSAVMDGAGLSVAATDEAAEQVTTVLPPILEAWRLLIKNGG